jgi:hypothetical protein
VSCCFCFIAVAAAYDNDDDRLSGGGGGAGYIQIPEFIGFKFNFVIIDAK